MPIRQCTSPNAPEATARWSSIGSSELYLVYQPIVALDSGQMVSVEALVRWNHPVMGPISPGEFIPIAEESTLIIAIGQWVLREACLAMVEWRRTDTERAPKYIGVNVSRAELALGDVFLEHTRDLLASVGLPPACLQLEVTEREVMRNPQACLELMRELRRLGVRLAMDDFGTGTSSLGLLRDYPFDTIKIDRSFVQDLIPNRDVLAVTHATIAMIANLGMASLAEGVEEPAQVAVLQSLGCRYAQGYLFSRPVRSDRLLDALESNRARELVALRAASLAPAQSAPAGSPARRRQA
jgi:EAL domain-containing protein (putative c-di-GMP-specific phosphodiesterase class I)